MVIDLGANMSSSILSFAGLAVFLLFYLFVKFGVIAMVGC
jgi:hypothetical protein